MKRPQTEQYNWQVAADRQKHILELDRQAGA